MLTRDQLHPAIDPLVAYLRDTLPRETFSRLRFGRAWVTHGTRRTLQLFEIWDRRQNALIPKSHFKYCVAYDPLQLNPGAGPLEDGYFHAWLNTIRIYRDRDTIVQKLRADIARLRLPGFTVGGPDRAVSVGSTFRWPDRPSDLVEAVGDRLRLLVASLHPLLVLHIDRLASGGYPDPDRAPRPAHSGTIRPDRIRDYTRSIPPSWRREILETQHFACAACHVDLRATGHHIDHIRPFARGGATERDNLQALCPACNLAKGASHTV
jgi:hypothetical protein